MALADPPRVVVADDSAMMRHIVTASLTQAGVKVVGGAADGDAALELCERERPDALTLDLTMPGLDGIGVLRALRRRHARLPVIVVSAFSAAHGARAVDALAEGAFDLVPKPAGRDGLDSFGATLSQTVLAAVQTGQTIGDPKSPLGTGPRRSFGISNGQSRVRSAASRAVVIATSTGGPKALAELLPLLKAPLGMGTLIVQHMPGGFTRSLAARLNDSAKLKVKEAEGGEILDPRVALLAPGGFHLRIDDAGRTRVSDEPEVGSLRPRADLTITDAARIFGERTLLVVMTGMGDDGLAGAHEVRARGGRILVQSADSCTVYGMPRAVAEAQLADEALPLEELAAAINQEAA